MDFSPGVAHAYGQLDVTGTPSRNDARQTSGFPAIESALWGRFSWELLLGLFVAQLLANCATLGSGGSGGASANTSSSGSGRGGSSATGSSQSSATSSI